MKIKCTKCNTKMDCKPTWYLRWCKCKSIGTDGDKFLGNWAHMEFSEMDSEDSEWVDWFKDHLDG